MQLENYPENKIEERSETYKIGKETLKDVLAELQRPGLDPRDELEAPCFSSTILDIKDLKIGDKLDGIIRNVTDFGAFVDIGLHSDGLVHKSQMANYFVANPVDVVKVGQQVKVKVLDIDLEREKVSLSMKDDSAPQEPRIEQRTEQNKKPNYNKKATERSKEVPQGGNETAGESSLRGNITFS